MKTLEVLTKDMYKKNMHNCTESEVVELVQEFKESALTVKKYIQAIFEGTITREMLLEFLEDEEIEAVLSLKEKTNLEKFSNWLNPFETENIGIYELSSYSDFNKVKNYLILLYEVFDSNYSKYESETVNVFIDNYPFPYSFDELGL